MLDRLCLYTPPLSTISSYFEMIDLAVASGITQLETINELELSVPNVEFARKLKTYADEANVSFPCVSLGINLVGDDFEEAIETAKKYVEIAAILHAPYFHHTIAFEFRDPDIVADRADTFYRRGICAVRSLYDYAEQYDIKTVYEDQGFLFNGVERFSRFLADVNRNVGVVADFGNIHFVDQSIENFVTMFADRIVHVHVKDYLLTSGKLRDIQKNEYRSLGNNYLCDCPLGEGNVPIMHGFERLKAIGYTGSVSLECPPMGENEMHVFQQNAMVLRRYLQNYLKY